MIVPSIVNAPWTIAKTQLDQAGLIYPASPPTTPSDLIAKGNVLKIDPGQGAKVPPDQAITVVLSSGHAPVPVPTVTNFLFDAAQTALTKAHFTVKREPDEFSSKVPSGRVISTGPVAGKDGAVRVGGGGRRLARAPIS